MEMAERVLGNYRLLRQLGEGGTSHVYLAEHVHVGQRAAVKILRDGLAGDSAAMKRFAAEVRAASRIDHPGVTAIYDFGVDGETAYLTMEYLEGETLARRLRERGKLSEVEALQIGIDVAEAVAAAHERGIVHRDLKPDNIFLAHTRDGERVKVLDFGVASVEDDREATTGTLSGTPRYIAPEQVRGLPIDARADIYTLGCVLFEMVAGEPPFGSTSVSSLLVAHLKLPPPSPRERAPALSDALSDTILRCLAKSPDERPASMAALVAALEAAWPTGAAPPRRTMTPTTTGVYARPRTPTPPITMAPASAGTGADRSRPSLLQGPIDILRAVAAVPVQVVSRLARGSHPPVPPSQAPLPPQPPVKTVMMSMGSSVAKPAIALGARSDGPDVAAVIAGALPSAFDDARALLGELFGALFAEASPLGQHMVELSRPSFHGGDGRDFFATFITRRDTASPDPAPPVGSMTFADYVLPLSERLALLDAPPGAVLIAILAVAELGPGVRETLFRYRRDEGVVIVPLYIGELRRSHRHQALRDLFLDRLHDLHAVADPFAMIGSAPDPTRCLGFGSLVNDLVGHIRKGGQIVSVSGLPGSGKTTLIALAEYEYGRDDGKEAFRYVRCTEGARDPAQLLTRIQALLGAEGEDADRCGVRDPERPFIIVLDDADWLIRMSARGADPAQAAAAQALWSSLDELCRRCGHTVIITSVRDFEAFALPELTKPLPVQRVLVRRLDRAGVADVVRELGALVNFRPTPSAIDRLAEASGGNIHALRSLCSAIFVSRRAARGYSPLAPLLVGRRDVARAIDQLAATTPAFRDAVQIWLDDGERAVLEHVARERPRSPRAVGRALCSVCAESRVRESLGSLQSMGLIAFERGRYRVTIPVLERWVRNHLESPPAHDRAERERRIMALAVGVTLTATMAGTYWTWLRSTRSRSTPVTEAGCRFEIDHPDRVGPGDRAEIYVHRECAPGAPGVERAFALETYGSAGVVEAPVVACGAGKLSCTSTTPVTLRDQAGDAYQLRLRVGEAALSTITMRRDPVASLRRATEQVFQIAWILPFAIGLFLAFHREVLSRIRDLFSLHRGGPGGDPGGPPPATPPAGPPTPTPTRAG